MPTEFKFDRLDHLADALAEKVAECVRSGLRERGKASMVVSGGQTPAPFLESLSSYELNWPDTWITLADERWVDSEDPESNERLVRLHLLRNFAASANFVGLKNSAATPLLGEAECDASLAKIPRPFEVVLLGMGEDGHTASLFPLARQLSLALDMGSNKRCIAIDPVAAPHLRMSLTLPTLLAAKRIVLLIVGGRKWDVYQDAMRQGPIETLPVRSILYQSQVPVDVYWSP